MSECSYRIDVGLRIVAFELQETVAARAKWHHFRHKGKAAEAKPIVSIVSLIGCTHSEIVGAKI